MIQTRRPHAVPPQQTMPTLIAPILADTLYISAGLVGAVLVILLIVWVLRRG